MSAFVLSSGAGVGKEFAASTALMSAFAAVSSLVIDQMAQLGEFLPAIATFMRFLARMQSFVRIPGPWVSETLAAILALIRRRRRPMDPLMGLHRCLMGEADAALSTLIRLITGVYSLMGRDICSIREDARTKSTPVLFRVDGGAAPVMPAALMGRGVTEPGESLVAITALIRRLAIVDASLVGLEGVKVTESFVAAADKALIRLLPVVHSLMCRQSAQMGEGLRA